MLPAKRLAYVREARSWIGNPYEPRGRIRGAGIDCAYMLIVPAVAAGLIYDFDPLPYAPDHMLHSREERYMETVQLFADEFEGPTLPGDIVLWRFGRCFAHGGIISGDPRAAEPTGWPWVVHAFAADLCVVETCVSNTPLLHEISYLKPRPTKFFRPRGIDA